VSDDDDDDVMMVIIMKDWMTIAMQNLGSKQMKTRLARVNAFRCPQRCRFGGFKEGRGTKMYKKKNNDWEI
jgi:hypothetical protein